MHVQELLGDRASQWQHALSPLSCSVNYVAGLLFGGLLMKEPEAHSIHERHVDKNVSQCGRSLFNSLLCRCSGSCGPEVVQAFQV